MNQKTEIRKQKSESGYTLIELLAVIIVLMTVGTIITVILISALRGGDRSATVNNVRQSGDYAISQMSKMITYARSFDGISDGTSWYANCVSPSVGAGTPTPVPPNYSALKVTSFDGGQTTFFCDNTNQAIASQSGSASPTYLTDTSTTVVTAGSCYFTCKQSSESAPPTINIYFDLNSKPSGSGITPFVEKRSSIHFEITVTMRNNP
jgi:type II secretory pathway pseudopilin PulG